MTTVPTLPAQLAAPVDDIIRRALAEDLGPTPDSPLGDLTTLATVPADLTLTARLVAKADGILAGLAVFARTFTLLDPATQLTFHAADGDSVTRGQVVAHLTGPGRALLTAERTALNLLQRMSGIATYTHALVTAATAANPRVRILDTRKTVPGLRALDKYAVTLGGGHNHRTGLYDMALIKENHIAAAGGITAAVQRVRAAYPDLPIEVEVTTLTELDEALPLNLNRILLDNMTLDQLRAAVAKTASTTPLEASGNVSLATVAQIAATGVDYISSGALTHSVTALDLSLLIDTPWQPHRSQP